MSSPSPSTDQLKVFISYSRKDMALANALADALEASGMDVLIDRRDLPYGEKWQVELAELIRNADTVVWLVSPSSVISRWCNWELGEVTRLNKRLVPVALEAIPPKELPEAIGSVQLLPSDGAFSFETHFEALKSTLETDREWLREQTRLADRARQWIARDRRPDLLLTAAQIADAQAWLDARRPTSPPPSGETLELLLASRRHRARRRQLMISAPFAVVAALGFPYAFLLWALTVHLPDTSLVLNDIVNTDGEAGFNDSYQGCRLRCVLNRFQLPCVAFTYDLSPDPPPAAKPSPASAGASRPRIREVSPERRRCFPKYSADFYWRPSKTLSEPADPEIMPVFFGARPVPRESPYRLHFFRTLAGEPVDLRDVFHLIGDLNVRFDQSTGRTMFTLGGPACLQTCLDLGSKCKGFAFSANESRCELFKSVKGVLRDASNRMPVFMPATVMACDDPDAERDPTSGYTDCPARYSWGSLTK